MAADIFTTMLAACERAIEAQRAINAAKAKLVCICPPRPDGRKRRRRWDHDWRHKCPKYNPPAPEAAKVRLTHPWRPNGCTTPGHTFRVFPGVMGAIVSVAPATVVPTAASYLVVEVKATALRAFAKKFAGMEVVDG